MGPPTISYFWQPIKPNIKINPKTNNRQEIIPKKEILKGQIQMYLRDLMSDPPETTTVKAPLSFANFSDKYAVYLANEIDNASSESKMFKFARPFFEFGNPHIP